MQISETFAKVANYYDDNPVLSKTVNKYKMTCVWVHNYAFLLCVPTQFLTIIIKTANFCIFTNKIFVSF